MRVVKPYTKIRLEKLESARLQLRADLAKLTETTGEKYSIRTFYLGPRKKGGYYKDSVQGTTNKADAYAAKLAVYKLQRSPYGGEYFSLHSYV